MASVTYEVEDPQGNSLPYTDAEVTQQLGKHMDVAGTTPDGLNAIIRNPNAKKGEDPTYNLPLQTAIEQQGFKVKGITPMNSSREAIDPWLSAKVQSIDDPSLHKQYLANTLAHSYGMPDATVIGKGNEYHVWDPGSKSWHQLTEEPKWNNVAGLYSAALALPHLAGMGVGSTVGAGVGMAGGPVGSGAGALLGAGAGSAAGESLRQAGLSLEDPDYAKVVEDNLGSVGSQVGKTALYDSAAEMGARALPLVTKAGRALAEEAGLQVPAGLGSTIVKNMSNGVGKIGKGLNWLGGAVADSPNAQETLAQLTPAGGLVQGAELASIPSAAIRGAAELAAKFPENKWLNWTVPKDTAARISEYGKGLLEENAPRTTADKVSGFAEEAANMMGGQEPTQYRTADVLHNWVNRMQNKGAAEEAFNTSPEWQNALRDQAGQDQLYEDLAPQYGIDLPKSFTADNQEALKRAVVDTTLRQTAREGGPNWGTGLGKMLEGVEGVGDAVRGTAKSAIGGTARVGQGVGMAAQAGGFVGKNAATLASPLELPTELRYGLPAVRQWWEDRKQKR